MFLSTAEFKPQKFFHSSNLRQRKLTLSMVQTVKLLPLLLLLIVYYLSMLVPFGCHDNNCNNETNRVEWNNFTKTRSINHMAELHVLGQLHSVLNFKEQSSLFCRFSFQAGPNWTLISGCSEGQTVTGQPDYKNRVVWAHPLDLHYVTKGIQGWPKLVVQVSCLESFGRSWIVGYGVCSLPASPGFYRIKVPCWVPTAVTVTDKIRQYFLGGAHQLTQVDIINLGTDRHKLCTESKGTVELNIHIVLRKFTQFGIEYK